MRGRILYINKYAFSSAPFLYLFCIAFNILNALNSFFILKYTEYNINAAFNLTKKTTTFDKVSKQILYFVIILVCFQLADLVKNNIENRLTLKIKYKYNSELCKKISAIKIDYFEMNKTLEKIEECKSSTLDFFINMVRDSIYILGLFPIMLVYGYFLSRINLILLIVYFIFLLLFNRTAVKRKAAAESLWENIRPLRQRAAYFFKVCEDKNSHQEYKFNRLYDFFRKKWLDNDNDEIALRIKIHKQAEIRLKSAQILFYLPRFLMLLYIAVGIMSGKYEVGFFVMVNTLLGNITNDLTNIQGIIERFRLEGHFIDNHKEVMNFENHKRHSASNGYIDFRKVSFCYPKTNKLALKNMNLSIQKGEKVAIVGENGSGKTTCVNMLLYLLQAVSGEIKGYSSSEISVVFQDFIQYQTTIKESIEFGCLRYKFTDEQIWQILSEVGLKEYVESLPEGIYTKLGQLEQGIELSKGQWQRLSIARLLANKNAKLWILDEPTAYLDPISEIEIYKLIYRLSGNRSVLFISHRLGFSRKADRILVFQEGQIVEEGKHDDLIIKKGVYEKMYRMQESWYK